MFQETFENNGFAQAAPGVWMREFIHPDSGEILRVDVQQKPKTGEIAARYTRGGRFFKDKKYWKSPKVAVNSILTSARRTGFIE